MDITTYNIVNCTPHDVVVLERSSCTFDEATKHWTTTSPEVKITYPAAPKDSIPRVSQTEDMIFVINGIPIYRNFYHNVIGIPAPEENTYYIVSLLVAKALPHRHDFLVPTRIVRDQDNHIVGCLGFAVVY